jgi:HAD superfamily hydrolase (TIGR01509 family)
MMPLRAVLFDMDGVLVDSYALWFALMDAAARELVGRPIDPEEFRAAWGQSTEADIAAWYPGCTVSQLEAYYNEHLPLHLDALVVMPDARQVVAVVRARGLATAVVTNAPSSIADRFLISAGIVVDTLVAGGDARAPKPAPDPILLACHRLGVDPLESLMVGDSPCDLLAAHAAGVSFLGVGSIGSATLRDALEVIDIRAAAARARRARV